MPSAEKLKRIPYALNVRTMASTLSRRTEVSPCPSTGTTGEIRLVGQLFGLAA